ncbi:invasion protein [Alteromonas aestuariivivens]|uniref:Invasion protein n=1 Tax=Alteromonas aestuariivivens TaxID=1938339 RepID=A0A3D8MBR8_9ALTE|nr:SirB2 family protein [Alteromonas aestuariivivens]RDV27571.1 invasion protein [Alteromonas aestuariivivens]
MYLMAKHIHLSAVALSIFLFVGRFLWSRFNASVLQKKWLKITPHIIDTVLLASALWLCFILSQYPFVNGWLTLKLFGVLAYILMGLIALKWARTSAVQWLGFVGALAFLAMTAHVAVTKQPLFF